MKKKDLKEIEVFLLNELVSKTITFSDIDVGVCNIDIPPVFREVFLDFYEPDLGERKKLLAKKIIGLSDKELNDIKDAELGTGDGIDFGDVSKDLLGDDEVFDGKTAKDIVDMNESDWEDFVFDWVGKKTGIDSDTLKTGGETILDIIDPAGAESTPGSSTTPRRTLEENKAVDMLKSLGGGIKDLGSLGAEKLGDVWTYGKEKLGKVDFRALQLQLFNAIFSDENIASISRMMSKITTAAGVLKIYCVLLQKALDIFNKMYMAFIEQREILEKEKEKEKTPPGEYSELDASF